MAKSANLNALKFTNPSSVAECHIDIDAGDRFNTYTKWSFSPSEVKAIDTGLINPVTDQPLVNALKSQQLTIVTSELDSITNIPIKNFIGSGIGVQYCIAADNIAAKKLVSYSAQTATIDYPTANGKPVIGATVADSTGGETVRIVKSGIITVIAGSDIKKGDTLITNAFGSVISSHDIGLTQVGVSTADYTTGEDVTFVFSPEVITETKPLGRLTESNNSKI